LELQLFQNLLEANGKDVSTTTKIILMWSEMRLFNRENPQGE